MGSSIIEWIAPGDFSRNMQETQEPLLEPLFLVVQSLKGGCLNNRQFDKFARYLRHLDQMARLAHIVIHRRWGIQLLFQFSSLLYNRCGDEPCRLRKSSNGPFQHPLLERGTDRSRHTKHGFLLKAGLVGREDILDCLIRNSVVRMDQTKNIGRFLHHHA